MKTRDNAVSSAALRSRFLEYFRAHGHAVVASSSLVPAQDPTLLFTNAGMVQFKDVFLGKDERPYRRAATAQRCVRAGGKHNDLENVGYTARHHTFFEMLGNFSFGDYFKRDAIRYAWQLITGELAIPRERLWVTVYETDDEAYELWRSEAGVEPARIARLGTDSNFWAMGETGPCGPCSEIFYDHGPGIAGGPPGTPDQDGDRYVEIWNLVFMQFDRAADGTMAALPRPSVDTGMGLERIAAVMQGVHSNYDIDLFRNLIRAAQRLTGARDAHSPSLRVIADHIRACAFLIVDGVVPSNEGRGYVLRRIIRRALRHGHKLGQTQPFFHALVPTLVDEMGASYPELAQGAGHASRVLRQEEERFAETLSSGMTVLESAISSLASAVIPGETVFRLYDTFGFPVDLTADIARERGLSIDHAGFEAAMAEQRNRARAASRFGSGQRTLADLEERSEFRGYETVEDSGTIVALLSADGERLERLNQGQHGQVVLDRTPFYGESGGQIGDRGTLAGGDGDFEVSDTQKQKDAHVHIGLVTRGALTVGDRVRAVVDAARRAATARNHSATHLLHAALKQVLGPHVQQKGSLVEPERLRFDFSHGQPVTLEERERIEQLVNAEILRNVAAETQVMGYDDALASGAVALFGEKYGDSVRVLKLGDFSVELCGGTHVARTGDIGLLKITSESGVAAGIRRLEAVTGAGALEYLDQGERIVRTIAGLVRGGREDVADKVATLLERARRLEKEVDQLKGRLATGGGTDLAASAVDVAGVRVVASRLDGADAKALRAAVDDLKSRLGPAVVVLGAVDGGDRVALVAGVTSELTSKIRAGDLVGQIAADVGGRGGGRADFAQAGGNNPAGLDAALARAVALIRERLAAPN
jgi:alanyl-tRNA synthetase